MGNTLAPLRRDLSRIDNDTARDAMEILDCLEDMAQDRIDLFYERISRPHYDINLIPIKKVLNKHTYITIKEGSNNDWASGVKEAVRDFCVGPVAEGLSSVATNTITKMLGSTAGKCHIEQSYTISLDALGGISRLDYFIFTYNFTSTELARRDANLIACCVVETSACIEGLDANTLRVIISRAFKGGNVPHSTLTAIHTQVAMVIDGLRNPFPTMSVKEKEDLEAWYNFQDCNKPDSRRVDSSRDGSGLYQATTPVLGILVSGLTQGTVFPTEAPQEEAILFLATERSPGVVSYPKYKSNNCSSFCTPQCVGSDPIMMHSPPPLLLTLSGPSPPKRLSGLMGGEAYQQTSTWVPGELSNVSSLSAWRFRT